MKRFFSCAGTIAIAHLGLVLLVIAYSRSLARPDGFLNVDQIPAYQMSIHTTAWIIVSLPIGWIGLLPTHTGGPAVGDIVFTCISLGVNSLLIGDMLARILGRRRSSKGK